MDTTPITEVLAMVHELQAAYKEANRERTTWTALSGRHRRAHDALVCCCPPPAQELPRG
jgi:hypothetical protein